MMEMKRSNIGIDKSIRTTRCNRAGAGRVGSNQFNLLPTMDTIISYRNGIYLNLCRNAQIKDNEFYQRTVGIFGTDDLTGGTGTLFSCNYFEDYIYGFYFYDADVDDQGTGSAGVDNVWVDHYAGVSEARMYIDVNSNFNYYHTTGASKNPFEMPVGSMDISISLTVNTASSSITDCSVLNKTTTQPQVYSTPNFLIYPNPNNGIFTVKYDYSDEFDAEYRVMTISGHLVAQGIVGRSDSKIYLNLPNGSYLFIITSQNSQERSLFSIQN